MLKTFVFLLLSVASVQAQAKFISGLGYIQPSYYRVDNEINPLPLGLSVVPMIAYRGERLTIYGPSVSYALIMGAIGFDLRLNAVGDRYKAYEVEQRDTAINLGASVRFFFLVISHGADIVKVYNGSITSVSLAYPLRISDSLFFTPKIGKEFVNNSYVNYYYGVKASEVGYFTEYRAENAVNDVVSIGMNMRFSEDQSLALNFSHKIFDKVIFDSPTIARKFLDVWGIFWSFAL